MYTSICMFPGHRGNFYNGTILLCCHGNVSCCRMKSVLWAPPSSSVECECVQWVTHHGNKETKSCCLFIRLFLMMAETEVVQPTVEPLWLIEVPVVSAGNRKLLRCQEVRTFQAKGTIEWAFNLIEILTTYHLPPLNLTLCTNNPHLHHQWLIYANKCNAGLEKGCTRKRGVRKTKRKRDKPLSTHPLCVNEYFPQ